MVSKTIGKDGKVYYFENGKRVPKPSSKRSTPKKTLSRRSPSPHIIVPLRQLFPRPVSPPSYRTTLANPEKEVIDKEYLSQFPKSQLYLRNYDWILSDFDQRRPVNQNEREEEMGELIRKKMFPLAVVFAHLLLRYYRADRLNPTLLHLVQRWKDRSNFCVNPLEEMEIDNKLFGKIRKRELKNKARWEKEEDEREERSNRESPYSPRTFYEDYPYVTQDDYRELIEKINDWLRLGELPPQIFIEKFIRRHVWKGSIWGEDEVFRPKMKEIIRQLYPLGSLNSYLQKFMTR